MNNNKNKYPTLKIITTYAVMGGLIGILPLLLFTILKLFNHFRADNNQVFVVSLIIWVVGFCSALLTGIILSYFRIKIIKLSDYFKPFLIGFGVTFICFIIIAIIKFIHKFNNDINSLLMSYIFMYLLLSLIYGMVSAVLANFILPKY